MGIEFMGNWRGPAGLNATGAAEDDEAVAAFAASSVTATGSLLRDSYSRRTPERRILCMGDSITQGNQDLSGVTFPALLGTSLPGVTVTNAGRSGWASADIAALFGVPFRLGAFTVPAGTGAVAVGVSWPDSGFRTSVEVFPTWLGELRLPNGSTIPGRLRHRIDAAASPVNGWTFERTTAGASTVVPAGGQFVCTEYTAEKASVLVIAFGRNNTSDPSVVVRDVNAVLAQHANARPPFVVLPVPTTVDEVEGTSAYREVVAVNAALKDAFPANYVDDRAVMIGRGLAMLGETPTEGDLWQQIEDTIPRSLLVDHVHPTAGGYRVKAWAVLEGLRRTGALDVAPLPVIGITPDAVGPMDWDTADLGITEGRAIDGWVDRISGLRLSQATSGARPSVITSAGRRIARFDGVDDMLVANLPFNLAQPYTVIALCKVRTFAGKRHGIAWSQGSPGSGVTLSSDGRVTLTGGLQSAAADVAADTYVVVAAALNGTSASIAVRQGGAVVTGNGGVDGIVTALRVGYAYDGVDTFANLDLAKLRIYPGAMTVDQIARVASQMTAI